MEMKLFRKELDELARRYGFQVSEPVEVEIAGAVKDEHYIHPNAEMRGLEMFKAVREVQPVRLKINIEANRTGPWRHSSNDPRRLHPDLLQGHQKALF